MLWLSLVAAELFAVTHLFSGKMRFLEGVPRSRWLSIAGGVSVAYVFMHMLPELSAGQDVLQAGTVGTRLPFMDRHVYLIALIGLIVFYGLERMAVASRGGEKKGPDETPPAVFWIHLVSFSIYNLIIGYLLLHREQDTLRSLILYVLAMGLHFVVTDFGLREHHKERYHTPGRWILAAAVLVGWAIGIGTQVGEEVVTVLFAFLAGGVVLNVLKEELPKERRSRFWAFALGSALYAVFVLVAT